MEDEFLTVREVAELLKINQQTIRNWIEPGIPGSIHYLDFPYADWVRDGPLVREARRFAVRIIGP